MAFLSYGEIKQYSTKIYDQQIIKSASILDRQKIVFLSHSRLDEDYIEGVIKFFDELKAPVYVDRKDDRLPVIPSLKTAQILRNAVKNCPKFVLLVSSNSKESIWIPWELGLADGFKGTAKVALLPITPTGIEEGWAEQEYLGLYPRVIFGALNNHPTNVWKVFDPRDNTSWLLNYWLHNPIS